MESEYLEAGAEERRDSHRERAIFMKHSYNALGGVGIIIVKETGKILHMGVRNKYCYICSQAQSQHIIPKPHTCYSNWTESSQAMEADIIEEGFKKAEITHGLRYLKLVVDGDSSVFARIQEDVPILGKHVSKVECANNVCKYLRSSLEKLVEENPRYKATRVSIVSAVRCAIRMRSRENDKSKASRLLAHDIRKSIHHIFGEHKNCSKFSRIGTVKSDANSNTLAGTRINVDRMIIVRGTGGVTLWRFIRKVIALYTTLQQTWHNLECTSVQSLMGKKSITFAAGDPGTPGVMREDQLKSCNKSKKDQRAVPPGGNKVNLKRLDNHMDLMQQTLFQILFIIRRKGKKRLTAFVFGNVKSINTCIPTFETLYKTFKRNEHTRKGLQDECISASQDGKVVENGINTGLIEVKNLVHAKPINLTQAVKCEKNKSHNYYYQCQGLLGVTGLPWLDFVTRTVNPYEINIERIYKDDKFWKNVMLPKLRAFY
ncbi:LOW QUALITY PROTEIN: hypothetical protein KUTeg_003771 [Tegillarca granosa]|uniref:Mutator-like transposase domain-containing protein n=1 Tax=Tegillarca granosa TaxID=220873 RepID=A0ABQ9FN29_TEGGR|nr:LOW QUALITY PROTEIN: hypothetical protein KUTeg_003771 [Tegillarca granosa]